MTILITSVLAVISISLLAIAAVVSIKLSVANSELARKNYENEDLSKKCQALEQTQQENITLQSKVAALSAQLEDFTKLKTDIEQYREQINNVSNQNSVLQTTIEQKQKAIDEKIKLLSDTEAKFKEVFQSLSAEVLKSNSTQFLELAKENLQRYQSEAKQDLEKRHLRFDELVKPINETLGNVDKKIAEVEKERQSSFRVLDEQIKSLRESESLLKSETANLVNALRRPTVRGRWGELQLRKVVEMAGMLKYCDFDEQFSGDSIRPDMIIKMPNSRQIIIDAKTPLEAYLNSVESTDETRREHFLNEHARHVHNHLKALGAKAYWQQFDQSPEFVVMFLPGEMFFSAALEKMPQLIERGIENKVIIATPTTLIALLQAVAYGWKQQQLAENAKQISELGRELYDRLTVMTSHLAGVGKSLEKATESYNKTIGSLESRVLVAARKFEQLGTAPEGSLKSPEPIDTKPREPLQKEQQ